MLNSRVTLEFSINTEAEFINSGELNGVDSYLEDYFTNFCTSLNAKDDTFKTYNSDILLCPSTSKYSTSVNMDEGKLEFDIVLSITNNKYDDIIKDDNLDEFVRYIRGPLEDYVECLENALTSYISEDPLFSSLPNAYMILYDLRLFAEIEPGQKELDLQYSPTTITLKEDIDDIIDDIIYSATIKEV